MDNLFGPDFSDFITALNECKVAYMMVGGYAVIVHGYHRSTGDLDIWVKCDKSNYQKIIAAFYKFGFPISSMPQEDFLNTEGTDVFRFGRPPVCIDIITKLKGVDFDEAFNKSMVIETKGIEVRLINYEYLIKSKLASGRTKDLLDLEKLEDE